MTFTADVEFNDGCAAQYKSVTSISEVAKRDIFTTRVYYESCHGKNKSDGLGGVVKWYATRAVSAASDENEVVIRNAFELYEFCCKTLATCNGEKKMLNRVFIYISKENMTEYRAGLTYERLIIFKIYRQFFFKKVIYFYVLRLCPFFPFVRPSVHMVEITSESVHRTFEIILIQKWDKINFSTIS